MPWRHIRHVVADQRIEKLPMVCNESGACCRALQPDFTTIPTAEAHQHRSPDCMFPAIPTITNSARVLKEPHGVLIPPHQKVTGRYRLTNLNIHRIHNGVGQPLEEIGKMMREHRALFVVDAVTSLGGHPVKTDEWLVDACYGATQKCLSCPPWTVTGHIQQQSYG